MDFSERQTQLKLFVVMSLLLSLHILCQFQLNEGADFMHGISPNYSNLFTKFQLFEGDRFRPWGTGAAPGSMANFTYVTLGFFYLLRETRITENPIKRKFIIGFKYLFLMATVYSALISNVRSAFIKCLLILFVSGLFVFMKSKNKVKFLFFSFLFSVVVINAGPGFNKFVESAKLENVVERYEGLATQGVTSQRSGLGKVISTLARRVDNIMGFGVGMTTTYLPDFEKRRKQRLDRKRFEFWALDNLYVFLILELGVGAIFYIFVILSLNFFLIGKTVFLYKGTDPVSLRYGAAAMATIFGITVGNWAAVALPFNPESFFVWFWVALGFRNYYHYLKRKPVS